MLLQIAKGWAFFAPVGGNTYCDPRDVAAGVLAAAERGGIGRRYILGGESLTYSQAWTIFAQVIGTRRPRLIIRRPVLTLSGFCGDTWTRLTGRELDINSAATRISTQSRNFTSRRAVAELGYRARPIGESATDAWAWFRQHKYV
jgi:dihydroflavonol-4-reductase